MLRLLSPYQQNASTSGVWVHGLAPSNHPVSQTVIFQEIYRRQHEINMLLRQLEQRDPGEDNAESDHPLNSVSKYMEKDTIDGDLSSSNVPLFSTVNGGDNHRSSLLTSPTQIQEPSSNTTPLKAMLFIDGTWLYYSIHEREENRCPIVQKFGKNWSRYYYVDWKELPKIISQQLLEMDPSWTSSSSHTASNNSGNDSIADTSQQSSYSASSYESASLSVSSLSRPIEITRASVFTSYKADTSKTSLRYKMYQDMKDASYDVHAIETVGKSEKCVDIQLAVEMLHYATLSGDKAYDVAILLSGDKDFMPAMIRTRQKGSRVALVSMRRSCNRALYEQDGLRDYPVIWIEDYLDRLVKKYDTDVREVAFSEESFNRIVNDYVAQSGFPRVSSRDMGRYLKFLKVGHTSVLDLLKESYGGLRFFLEKVGGYELTGDKNQEHEEYSDKAYWVALRRDEGDVGEIGQWREASSSQSKLEREFFDTYSLDILKDRTSAYFVTHSVFQEEDRITDSEELSPSSDEPIDYSAYTVAELKLFCRERGLPVSGVKKALVERLSHETKSDVTLGGRPARHSRVARPLLASMTKETATYLSDLVIEYLQASGSEADSRILGRYLAANKPSEDGRSKYQSALQEIKGIFNRLSSFFVYFNNIFGIDDTVASGTNDDSDGKYSFRVYLKSSIRV